MALTKIDDRGLTTPIDLLDNEKIRFGTGNDTEIYFDGTDQYFTSAGKFRFKHGTDTAIKTLVDGGVYLYHDNSLKLNTNSSGVDVTGVMQCDEFKLLDGEHAKFGTGEDLRIYHDGSNSFIDEVGTGVLKISGSAGVYINKFAHTETCAAFLHDSAVELYFDGVKKLETHTTGVVVHGNISPDNLYLGDNEKAYFGDGSDLKIYHDGSYNIIEGMTSGQDLYMGVQNEGDEVGLVKSTHAEWLVRGIVGGASSLYWDGSQKLFTTSLGVQTSGSLGLSIDPSPYYAKDLVLQAASEGGITIKSAATTHWNYLMFADGDSGANRYEGYLAYSHANNDMRIAVNSGTAAKLFDFKASGDLDIDDGNLVVASGHGIDFSATSGSGDSELFSDYEEGTWTAGLVTGTATHDKTKYRKIGSVVHLWGRLYSPSDTTSTNQVIVTGLPFAVSDGTAVGSCFGKDIDNKETLTTFVNTSEQMYFYGLQNSNAWNSMKHNDFGASVELYYHVTYHTT